MIRPAWLHSRIILKFGMAAPTPDHFIPLLYVAGLAAAGAEPAEVLTEGCSMGSLSMTSYTVGCPPAGRGGRRRASTLPHVPADETNI